MTVQERVQLADELYLQQPTLLASILVLHRMGVSMPQLHVLRKKPVYARPASSPPKSVAMTSIGKLRDALEPAGARRGRLMLAKRRSAKPVVEDVFSPTN